MTNRVLEKFKNLIDVADNNRKNQNLYFFIKNYAFSTAYNILSKDYTGIKENDRAIFENMRSQFKLEKETIKPNHVMSKNEYISFLEYFYSNINFDDCSLYVLEVSKDLTEVLAIFGEFDDLWIKRCKFIYIIHLVDYFTKRINYAKGDTINNCKQSNNNENNIQNNISEVVLSNKQNYYSLLENQRLTQSVDELNLPNVKDDEPDINQRIDKISYDHNIIPRLVDRSIKLPINKNSPNYSKVKDLIKMHMEYSGLELDFHKIELTKDHIEAAIYYLRNIE
jgi:hypothetical protein